MVAILSRPQYVEYKIQSCTHANRSFIIYLRLQIIFDIHVYLLHKLLVCRRLKTPWPTCKVIAMDKRTGMQHISFWATYVPGCTIFQDETFFCFTTKSFRTYSYFARGKGNDANKIHFIHLL